MRMFECFRGRKIGSGMVPALAALMLSWGVAAAGPALAQGAEAEAEPKHPFLDIGETQGQLTSGSECYYLQTEPGSHWDISVRAQRFDAYLTIGTGTSCQSIRPILRSDDANGLNPRTQFTASGGTYLVRVTVSGWSSLLGGGSKGDFVIAVSEGKPGGRKLPAGAQIAGAPSARDASLSASTAPASGEPVPAKGTTIKDCDDCPQLVVIPAGSFMMGSSAEEEGRNANEGPRHLVTIGRPFAIGVHEVTFDEWAACVRDKGCTYTTPRDNGWGRGRRPVVDVSWNDAMQYVRWLSRKTGRQYFLPSEAEWEYAARAGTQTPWNTGKAIITDDANILNALQRTVPVGGFPANAFGVHDVHGNVREWVADCYEVGYFGTPTDGGAMASTGCKERVIRGGSFSNIPADSRSAWRTKQPPTGRFSNAGFRVARAL